MGTGCVAGAADERSSLIERLRVAPAKLNAPASRADLEL